MTDQPLHRALLISGSLGKGHDVLAEACAAALEARGVACETVDAMRLLGSGPGAVGDWVFRRLLSVNAIYDAFHFSQLRDDGRLAGLMDRLAVDWMFPHLRQAVERFDPRADRFGVRHRRRRGRPPESRGLPGDLSGRHDRFLRSPLLGP